MGCFGSRFDKRAAESGDLNSVGLQFVGGEAHEPTGYPVDYFVYHVTGGEGDAKAPLDLNVQFPTEGGKATDEKITTDIFIKGFKAVEALLK
jgi:hypothetical protein